MLADAALSPAHRLGDVLPNDPNPCAPRLHPFNDPLPLQNWVPYIALAVAVLTFAAVAKKGNR
jgi:hypothetical protein